MLRFIKKNGLSAIPNTDELRVVHDPVLQKELQKKEDQRIADAIAKETREEAARVKAEETKPKPGRPAKVSTNV